MRELGFVPGLERFSIAGVWTGRQNRWEGEQYHGVSNSQAQEMIQVIFGRAKQFLGCGLVLSVLLAAALAAGCGSEEGEGYYRNLG